MGVTRSRKLRRSSASRSTITANPTARAYVEANASLTGELPPHVPVIMEVGVVERLRRGGFNVIAPKDVSERSADAATCEDASCWRTIASTNGARYLVRVDVKIVDRDYELALQLIDGTTGEQAADATGLCDLCGHDEVSDMLANKAATLSRAIAIKAATSPTLSVQSEPPGGQVFVDGELAGVAPLELELPPGAHEVRVEKPGFYAQAREVTLVDGVRESVRVELLEVPSAEAKDKERRGRVLRGIGWAGVATGVGALASGAALIAIDQRPITSDCAGENIDINGTCKYRYATLEGGIALTAVGVALAATGIALLVVGRKRERAPSSKVRAQVRATGLQLRF